MTDLFASDNRFEPATFSPCRTWRYRLERRWSAGPKAAFILLNPSTADETKDDPTIRRCIGFAKAWGFGGLVLGNIFALRSTDPRGLYSHADPVGPGNDDALRGIAREAEKVICGWGTHGALNRRGVFALDVMREAGATPLALKVTAAGFPGHPLYISADMIPEVFR
ncbi:MAG: DUF1643 domain-containing protein [Mesorhizobium sp.]|uniref:DUF1643 domain-containing protein n=1 Tax=Mesorhizobium sp. TaxID=1871066 RepID=UPI00122156A0|nr:DUF1643 domain-containing protein [Mesorhizobium sp.]TIM41798.1 MAG: DUF1643 domain-containing protein [Mesorhizobium sp.]